MTPSLPPTNFVGQLKRRRRWLWTVGLVAAVVLVGLWLRRGRHGEAEGATFAARRGPLKITVLQGGSIRAVESQEIKCEVRAAYQGIKILKIVEEGYEVTPEDIRTNKVLVELDSSDLQKQVVQQDIQFESAAASLIDAQQNYEIQLNQNLSDLKAAEQKARFARMDFDKFLGDKVTQAIVDQLGLDRALAVEQTDALAKAAALVAAPPNRAQSGAAAAGTNGANAAPARLAGPAMPTNEPVAAASRTPSRNRGDGSDAGPDAPRRAEPVAPAASVAIDFSPYAKIEALGDGEAKQKLRKFEDDLQVAMKEQGQAKANLEGTRRLCEKGFVTKIDLEKDEIANENNRLKVQTAVTARDLFLKYEFPKTAEEWLSKYAEAVRELTRARKAAVSKLAQAEARLKSAQGQYNIQARQRKELYDQQEKCTITAKRPGLVVYGGGSDEDYYYGGGERVREGATMRERQSIITIPDMTKMSVRVKIHESYIKKIKKGQAARITVDAFPDTVLEGEVSKVGVLPDSQNRWMNPDMKVYLTTININGTNDWLKPGMSAKVEILVNTLSNVVYVPVQAVSPLEGKQVCYLANGRKPERCPVEIGEFNDEFIEVKSGIKEGDRVLLRAVESQAPEKTEEKPPQAPAGKAAPQPAPPPATAAASPKPKA